MFIPRGQVPPEGKVMLLILASEYYICRYIHMYVKLENDRQGLIDKWGLWQLLHQHGFNWLQRRKSFGPRQSDRKWF
jgi:transposase